MPKPLKTFLSYSHLDKELKKPLLKQMINLMEEGLYQVWDDGLIEPGTKWEPDILNKLKESQVVLLLISENFISSDYCRGKELKIALEKASSTNAHIIPILLSECDWTASSLGLGQYQAIPRDNKAIVNINHWGSRENGMLEVIKELRALAEKLIPTNQIQSVTEIDVSSLPNPTSGKEVYEIDKYSCDRNEQQNSFEEHLYDYEDSNFHFNFLSGNKEEQVDSFINRVYLEILSEEADDAIQSLNVSDKSSVTFTFLNKVEHSIKKFRKNLIRDIHKQSDESISSDYTFKDLAALSVFDSLNALVINVKVYSEDWLDSDHGDKLVRWLFEDFFRQSIIEGCGFKVIVFFSIIFNHENSSDSDTKKAGIKRQISRGVAELRKSDLGKYIDSSYCEISELPQVPQNDLEDWFSSFYSNAYDAKEVMKRLFTDEKPLRTMGEIEQKTHPMIEEFLNRKNGI